MGGEWPWDMELSQQRCVVCIMKGAFEQMNRSGVWLKLRLHVGDQWEERLEKRDWAVIRVLKELGGMR